VQRALGLFSIYEDGGVEWWKVWRGPVGPWDGRCPGLERRLLVGREVRMEVDNER